LTDEEKKYKKIISSLKALPKVKAKSNFEQKLYRKLRSVDEERMSPSLQKLTQPAEKNWIFNIFKPALVPAVGITLALIAVVVIYLNFKPDNDTTVSTEQQTTQQEFVITKPEDKGSKSSSLSEEPPPISHELSESELKRESTEPEPPKSNLETLTPVTQPEEKTEEGLEGKSMDTPVIEQKIDRKETKGVESEKKEIKLEKKTDNLKKNENEDFPMMKNAEEKSEENKINDEMLKRALEPSLGIDKAKVKDTTKVDSMKSANKKKKENGKDTNSVKQEDNEKQAEPVIEEPEYKAPVNEEK
jgi:hypothetical protein